MSNLIFIKARGGLTTGERLLQVINQYPDGCTIKHLSNSINRPVSMINLSLKALIRPKHRVLVMRGSEQ